MKSLVYKLMFSLLFLFSFVEVMAQPVISGLNSHELPRSGRVAIEGNGFGTAGQVIIGGLTAWTTTWADTRVVAYIPEASALASTSLYIVTGGVQSNQELLTVTARQSSGRVRWTFEADADNLWWRPALAPDGTIYLHTNTDRDGIVYALSPDGGLKWVQKVNWYPYVPPSAGPDGAVYVGSISTIYRISPDGGIDWQYRDPGSPKIQVSPTVGPDGLVYGAFEITGAFARNALTGDLVWVNPGTPTMTDKSGDSVEMRFGPSGPGQPVDQLYVSFDGGAGVYAFSLDGDQLFTANLGNLKGTAEVAVGSDGTIYGPTSIGLEVVAVDPGDGTILWRYYPGPMEWATGTDNVEIGPDDMLYFVGTGYKLVSFDPRTQSKRWQEATVLDNLKRPTVTPDGSKLIVTGSDNDIFGNPGFVKAFDSGNGRELWRFDLPFSLDPGFRVYGTHHARITPDSRTAYVSTFSLATWPVPQDHAFLYALDIGSGGTTPPPPDPCDYDGFCTTGEDCLNCPGDCPGVTSGKPSKRWCCGDSTCSGKENGSVCALDCGAPAQCGDFVCDQEQGESSCTCAEDCGLPPISESICNDGVDNNCNRDTDCDDGECSADPFCQQSCKPKNNSCLLDSHCCSGTCKGNGRCR